MANILIVGDGSSIREFLATLLGHGGHHLLQAGDGAEALALVRAKRPDLVIADICMPVLDGPAFLRQLRGDPAIAATPVLFVLAAPLDLSAESRNQYAGMLHHAPALERAAAERQRAQEALCENEARFQSIFEHTKVAMAVTDLQHRFIRVNAAFAQMLGYSQEELLARTMGDITHPDHLAESYARRKALLAGEISFFQMEKRYLHKDGRVLWGLTNVSLVRDARGQPYQYVGQVQDVTERKRTEADLQAAQQRLQHLIVSSPAVLYTLAVEGDQIPGMAWVSDNVRELLGYPAEEVSAPGWWQEHVHPEDRAAAMTRTRQELFAHGQVANEYRIRHRDGTYHWLHSEIRLVRDAAGKPVEAVGSWSDISERKQLEDQFRQSQKMEAVGRLAGGVAHDFNNLLTVINGYGELVLDRLPATDPLRALIREVVTAGSRAAALTRQLLAFSRKAIIEPKILDLNVVVANVDKMLRRIIGEDVQLTIVAEPEVGAIKADPGQVEQVLLNLVVNARDAMPRGGQLTVEVRNAELDEAYARSHPEARPGPYVLLAVSDTGCGMDQATMAHIFEPFFSTKGDRGTGLGLATVHGIVKQSGGHLAVYSEVGHGTTFKVYLPCVAQAPSASGSHYGLELLPSGSETVLLVEDEDGVRALARHVLQTCGYKILEAHDGAEALRLAAQHRDRIDLLVTDVIMPQVGGREVAERLAALHPEAKVLFLSGYTDDAVVRHGILKAEVAFLQKPFRPLALAGKVREVLDSGPGEPGPSFGRAPLGNALAALPINEREEACPRS